MIESLTAYTRENWDQWFGGGPGDVSIALGSGGPAHRTRAACFVFSDRERKPNLVMKIAFAEQEAGFLAQEHASLTELRPLLPAGMRETIPEAVDLAEVEGNTVMVMRAVGGKRLLVPDLTGTGGRAGINLMRRFYRESFRWSRELGRVTAGEEPGDGSDLAEIVARFRSLLDAGGGLDGRLAGFEEAVESSGISWHACWQHQDLAVGNVLVDRAVMRFLDWEHAGQGSQPWFDITQSVGASARLAKRQSGVATSRQAAVRALGQSGWAGGVLASELNKIWDFDLPLGWGIALTSMATALRQSEDDRMGAEDWADFAVALFDDAELRREIPWAVPTW